MFPMIWGYHVPEINRTIPNARIETAAEKSTFKDGWATHRCAVPASWYYEWERFSTSSGKAKVGNKYAIMPKGSKVTWLCGLYRLEDDFPHFVVITRAPGESITFIHDRMPFILPESEVEKWIDPNFNPNMLVTTALTDMVFEKEEQVRKAVRKNVSL